MTILFHHQLSSISIPVLNKLVHYSKIGLQMAEILMMKADKT